MALFPTQNHIKDDVLLQLVEYPKLYVNAGWARRVTFICCTVFFAQVPLFGFVQLLANLNANYWLNHCLATFGSLSVIISCATLLGKRSDCQSIIDTFFPQFWPLNGDPSNYAVLKRQGSIVKLYYLGLAILFTVAAACFVPMDEYNYSHVAVSQLFVDNFGLPAAYLIAIPLYISVFHAFYAVPMCASIVAYLTLHLKFQLIFLNDRLMKMRVKREEDSISETMENLNYQTKIRRELVACFEHYCLLERYANRINAMIFYPIFGFVLSGIAVTLGIIANMKNSAKNMSGFTMKPVLVVSAAGITSASFSVIGQLLEDESEKVFYSTVNLPWHLWNVENRKLVMMLLVASQKQLSLSSAGIISLNNRLVIDLFRVYYSIVMFLMNI